MGWYCTFPLVQASDGYWYDSSTPPKLVDMQAWLFVQQFYLAMQEKARAIGYCHWPREWTWGLGEVEYGTITGAIDNNNLIVDQPHQNSGGHWYRPPDLPAQPIPNWPYNQWEMVIDNLAGQPWTCWRINGVGPNFTGVAVGANSYVMSVDGGVVAGLISAGAISSVNDLVGKSYFIQPQNAICWADRWPEAPYDKAGKKSYGQGGGALFAWDRGYPIGGSNASGGNAVQRWTPAPANRNGQSPNGYYPLSHRNGNGLISPAYTTTDGTNSWNFTIPSASIWDNLGSNPFNLPNTPFSYAYDADCWGDYNINITQTNWGKCFSVDLYKTLRGLQLGVLMMGYNYCSDNPSNAANWLYVPRYLPTKLLPAASGCNAGDILKPYTIVWVYVVVSVWSKDSTGAKTLTMYETYTTVQADANGVWTNPIPASDVEPPTPTSGTVTWRTYSNGLFLRGPTKKWPRQVKNMFYPRTVFVPYYRLETDYPAGSPVVNDYGPKDPPQSGSSDTGGTGTPEVGWWVTRSTDNLYVDGEAFVEGDVAREIGDSIQDPTWAHWVLPYNSQWEGYAVNVDPLRPTAPMRQYVGQANRLVTPAQQAQIYASQRELMNPRGLDVTLAVTAGGSGWLQCADTKGWLGAMIEHDGVPTNSTTTSFSDTTKSTDNFWKKTINGLATGRWEGFIAELQLADGSWWRQPISAYVEATQTVSWSSPLPSAPVAYRIREPHFERNMWRNHKLTITRNGTAVGTATILYNDDLFCWFSGALTPQAGDVATIEVIVPGQCWMRRSGQWIKPPTSETDPRGGTYWPDNQTTIHPTTVSYWGLYSLYDYVGPWLYNELHDQIHAYQYPVYGCTFSWGATDVNGVTHTDLMNTQGESTANLQAPAFPNGATWFPSRQTLGDPTGHPPQNTIQPVCNYFDWVQLTYSGITTYANGRGWMNGYPTVTLSLSPYITPNSVWVVFQKKISRAFTTQTKPQYGPGTVLSYSSTADQSIIPLSLHMVSRLVYIGDLFVGLNNEQPLAPAPPSPPSGSAGYGTVSEVTTYTNPAVVMDVSSQMQY